MRFIVKVRDPLKEEQKIEVAAARSLDDVTGLSEFERDWLKITRANKIEQCAIRAGGTDEKTVAYDTGKGEAVIVARNL